MIRMGVGDEHRVDVLRLQVRLTQAILNRLPRERTRQPGIDDGRSIGVEQDVHVHMTEPRHTDGQLGAQNVRRHLGDLGAGDFLFLSMGHGTLFPSLVLHEIVD